MKKTLLLAVIAIIAAVNVCAQGQKPKFSPEQFDAELHQYIVQEAGLTHEEAMRFFPLYNELQFKLREVFAKQRMQAKVKPTDEEGCRKTVRERDRLELELKTIQQTYHNKFLEVLSASKVYDIIKAEDRFHRHKLRQWSNHKAKK